MYVKRIKIVNHAGLIKSLGTVKEKVKKDPKMGMMFMVNPIQALKESGFKLDESMASHVQEKMASLNMAEGRKSLFKKVKSGEARIPWVKNITFRTSEG